ncbi:MAG: DUF4230 domain-containing protein [Crocinitomicaceae bacterium]|nr:DUF4230 domain-containing protein [Crocinitomicaceae bacterium]
MKNWFYYIALFVFITACSSENDIPEDQVYAIREIGILSTTEYTIGKVIKLDDSDLGLDEIDWSDLSWTDLDNIPKIGDRKLLISCKAKVKAGVDLSQIKDSDITIKGNTIEIILPPATITSFSMDPKSVHTEMENISGFRDPFTQEEKTNFLQQGEEAILEDLDQSTILKDATDNAEIFLQDFYKQLGFEEVIIKRSSDQ